MFDFHSDLIILLLKKIKIVFVHFLCNILRFLFAHARALAGGVCCLPLSY